jgi:hypothetical protein
MEYTFSELKSYLEGYVESEASKTIEDKKFMEDMNWTEEDAMLNTIKNLQQSLKIVFPELIEIKV